MSKKILISAGEASGDLHGGNLVKAIRELRPDWEFVGIGGDHMAAQGVRLLHHCKELAVVGGTEVLSKLGLVFKVWGELGRYIKKERPDLFIPVDFPDFNFRVAKKAKKNGVPVVYYISPQVWAWRSHRVSVIKKLAKMILVILPFEESLYRLAGVPVEFVGHPLLDVIKSNMNREETQKNWGMDGVFPVIGLLPGSRKKEVQYLLKDMLAAAAIIKERYPSARFLLGLAPTLHLEDVEPVIKASGLEVTVKEGQTYEVMNASDFLLVTSGTATLESALIGTPMVIVYRLSWISYFLGRLLVDIPYFGLANFAAGYKIVPELLQHEVTGPNMAQVALSYLDSPPKMELMQRELKKARERLGTPGAARRAALVVIGVVEGK